LKKGDKIRPGRSPSTYRVQEVISDTEGILSEDTGETSPLTESCQDTWVTYEVLEYVDQSNVFSAAHEALRDGRCIGIFPEGGSHDNTDLLPLKPGITTIAFGTLDKFDLNVSPQQLRFVVSDADENEDGVIDIMEYIPLAVDVILTFGARNKAEVLMNEESILFAAEIYRNVSLEGIDALTHIVLAKIKELDPTNSGYIHINQFRKILNSLGSSGPTELETTYVCENLHKDVHKKIRYQNLNNVFHNAKLLSERINKLKGLKNEVLV
jgi:hypothetical protein